MLFEVVQIEQHECEHALGPFSMDFRLLPARPQMPPVGQAGQGIKIGLLPDDRFALLVFGDVVRDTERPDDVALGTTQRKFGRQVPAFAPITPLLVMQLAVNALSGFHDTTLFCSGLRRVFCRVKVGVTLAYGFFGIVQAITASQAGVDANEAGLMVFEINLVGDVVDQRQQQVVLVGSLAAQLVGFGNVVPVHDDALFTVIDDEVVRTTTEPTPTARAEMDFFAQMSIQHPDKEAVFG